jgi:NDP-sugar pyrophosphorylase family protein
MSPVSARDGLELPTICILAGGRGARLGRHTAKVPKPMVQVAGRPFLEHQLSLLADRGARRVVICVGYLGDRIMDGIGDGAHLGLEVAYSDEGREPVGTARAVARALPLLGESFLVIYGDTYLDVDYHAVAMAHRTRGLLATMTVYRNRGALAPSNAVVAKDIVVHYNKTAPSPDAEWIDFGLLAFERRGFLVDVPDDLSELLSRLSHDGQLAGLPVDTRFYEIGTSEALRETEVFLASKRPVRR